MKIRIILGLFALGLMTSCGDGELKSFKLSNQQDSLAYAFGVYVADDLDNGKLPLLNAEVVRNGVQDYNDSNLTYDINACYTIFQTINREISSGALGINTSKEDIVQAKTDSLSYAVGAMLCQTYKQMDMDQLSPIAVQAAISDYADSSFRFPKAECIAFYKRTAEEIQAKQRQAEMELYMPNKKAGEDFLAENKNKPGVVTTETGLQYLVIKEGTGPKPTFSDQVTVHYTGKTLSGEVFDSSVDRGEPITFGLTGVIKGWTEGLQLMNVGSKYQFFIPQELAYGSQKMSALITPFSTLVFEVELLDFGPVPTPQMPSK